MTKTGRNLILRQTYIKVCVFCDNLFFFYEFFCSRGYKIKAFYMSNYSIIIKHKSVLFLVEKHKLVLFDEKLDRHIHGVINQERIWDKN